MKVLLVCSCPGMDEFAKEAFGMLFHGEDTPEVFIGKDKIMVLANRLSGDAKDYVSAIGMNKSKFAYYVDINDNEVSVAYNLKSGARVA